MKKFPERSPARRLLAAAVLVFSLGIVTAAERDIQRRDDSEVRGKKLIWRLVSLNALGAVAYFGRGRA